MGKLRFREARFGFRRCFRSFRFIFCGFVRFGFLWVGGRRFLDSERGFRFFSSLESCVFIFMLFWGLGNGDS